MFSLVSFLGPVFSGVIGYSAATGIINEQVTGEISSFLIMLVKFLGVVIFAFGWRVAEFLANKYFPKKPEDSPLEKFQPE